MVRQHQEDDGQRQVVVVGRALLGLLAERRDRASLPASSVATTFFWFGMMTKNTLADIQVAIIAPVWRKAARPLKTWVKAKAASKDVDEQRDAEHERVPAERRAAQALIDEPAQRQPADADGAPPARARGRAQRDRSCRDRRAGNRPRRGGRSR